MKEKLHINKKIEEKTKKMVTDYKKFAIKNNALELAIGVVIASAFTNIVNTFVANVVTPVLNLILKDVNLNNLYISLSGGSYATIEEAKAAGAIIMNYGSIISAIINFVILSFILFVIFRYISKSQKKEQTQVALITKQCDFCKSTIDLHAIKCAFCTSDLLPEETMPIEESLH